MAYDPDHPADLDPFGADFDALDQADAARLREVDRVSTLADLSEDEETPVQGDLFDLLYGNGAEAVLQ